MSTESRQIVAASVKLKFRAASGYRGQTDFLTAPGTKAEQTLINAAKEITRVLAIAGHGEVLLKEIQDQLQAVADWEKQHDAARTD